MGLINTIFGNASEVDSNALREEFQPWLIEGEVIEKAYKMIRDKWVFTNKRLIIQNTQGVSGKKKEYQSIPYHAVERFSVETAGTFDMDSDIKVWVKGCEEAFEQKIGRDNNVAEIQQILAKYVL